MAVWAAGGPRQPSSGQESGGLAASLPPVGGKPRADCSPLWASVDQMAPRPSHLEAQKRSWPFPAKHLISSRTGTPLSRAPTPLPPGAGGGAAGSPRPAGRQSLPAPPGPHPCCCRAHSPATINYLASKGGRFLHESRLWTRHCARHFPTMKMVPEASIDLPSQRGY